MENTTIKKEVNENCRKDGALLQKIASKTGKHFGTVQRWFYTDSPMLLNIDVLAIIQAHTGLTEVEIIESTPVNA